MPSTPTGPAARPGSWPRSTEPGVLAASDVHVALRLGPAGRRSKTTRVALAARSPPGPRGSATSASTWPAIRDTASSDTEGAVDLDGLAVARRDGVGRHGGGQRALVGDDRPLHLEGSALPRPLLAGRAPGGRRSARRAARRRPTWTMNCWPTGLAALFDGRGRPRPAAAGGGGRRPACHSRWSPAARAPARRPRWPDARPARRAGDRRRSSAAARRPGRADRQGGGPPGGGRTSRSGRRCRSTTACGPGCSALPGSRCTACSVSTRAIAAGSATTADNRLPHDVSSSTRRRWCSLSLMARWSRRSAPTPA